jgi:hypothetical protein
MQFRAGAGDARRTRRRDHWSGVHARQPTLEQRIANALTGDLPSIELGELLTANDAAIVAAEQAAQAAKEFAYDPTLSRDIAEARDRMETSALLLGRLQTLRPRLLTKYRETYLREQAAEWRGLSADITNEGTALAEEMRAVYSDAAAKLVDIFSRIADYKKRRDQLYLRRPDCISDQLPDPELLARKLNGGFTITTPSLLEATKLFDLETGKEIWPPPQVPFGVRMAASMQFNPDVRYTSEWWKANEVRVAAAHAESERTAARFAQMKKDQEERQSREERERFTAARAIK